MALYGGIEAGGTKFVCAVGTGPQDVRAEARFPTATPDETIAQALAFFRETTQASAASSQRGEPLSAVGIASFGPIDPDPSSRTFGYITNTPKPGWAHTDLGGIIRRELHVPVGFDTDVNVAAYGEHRWGAAQGLDTFIYLTVGTGIGGGGMVNGRLIHGLMHPEMGHIRVPHDWAKDPFAGCCPYHGDCWEGLANGPALVQRWGQRGDSMPPDHPAWALEAEYLALGVVNLILPLSPQRVVIGGGVMEHAFLLPMVRTRVQALLNHYVSMPAIEEQIERYLVPPGLGTRSGVLGAIALAEAVSSP